MQARIEPYLRAQGFTRRDEIEGGDNGRVWKMDDARYMDSGKHEVKLNAQMLQEVARHLD